MICWGAQYTGSLIIGNGTLQHQKWYYLNKKFFLKDKTNSNTHLYYYLVVVEMTSKK